MNGFSCLVIFTSSFLWHLYVIFIPSLSVSSGKTWTWFILFPDALFILLVLNSASKSKPIFDRSGILPNSFRYLSFNCPFKHMHTWPCSVPLSYRLQMLLVLLFTCYCTLTLSVSNLGFPCTSWSAPSLFFSPFLWRGLCFFVFVFKCSQYSIHVTIWA